MGSSFSGPGQSRHAAVGIAHQPCSWPVMGGKLPFVCYFDVKEAQMHISESNGTFTAQHVTGPTHNMLRLKLRNGTPQEFVLTVLPAIGDCRHSGGSTLDEIVLEIKAGLAAANESLAMSFAVEAAAIVENDTRQPGIYDLLTR